MCLLQALNPDTRIGSKASSCTWSHDLASGSLHREAAPVSSVMLLHRDSILVASQLVPRLRQLAIKLAPGWQKPRHASLHSGWCLDAAMNENTAPAYSHSATFTNTYRRTVSIQAGCVSNRLLIIKYLPSRLYKYVLLII
jgi:hypothetical protein